MSLRIAINGFGRIGRSVLRALYEYGDTGDVRIVAINELGDCKTVAHLLRYDSTHGRFPGTIQIADDLLTVNSDAIRVFHREDIRTLPWNDLDIDVVLECTGSFSDRATAEQHLQVGARRVLFSQPADADVDLTVVYGINHRQLNPEHKIISAASCSTNCVVPVIDILDREFGVESGVITTIHSAMNDQPVIDAYHHTDLRKTRSAMQSIIPVDTGLARGIGRILPHMDERFEAQAMRVPTINVSAIDLSVQLAKSTSVRQINSLMQSKANQSLANVLGYTEEPLTSCDFIHDPHSGIVDASQTRVAGGKLVKLLLWFDNEWGYANRMLDILRHWKTVV